MTNLEKIKAMDAWEMATFIYDVSCNTTKITTCEEECAKCEFTDGYCIGGIGEWLNSKAGGENE